MNIELTYVLVTPYTLKKSRTGGILARLLSRTDLDFVSAQIVRFDQKSAEKYAQQVEETMSKDNELIGTLAGEYIRENFSPNKATGRMHRAFLLLFRGENACQKITDIVGTFRNIDNSSIVYGETIRDTYADLVFEKNSKKEVKFFEPAVFTPKTQELAIPKLNLLANVARNSDNIISLTRSAEELSAFEKTLVIIKPDNWRHPSSRPGNIIDMLSRTSLEIVGCKTYRMSVNQALEFYGPVKDVLREKLAPSIAENAAETLEHKFAVALDERDVELLRKSIGDRYAIQQFEEIIKFMAGSKPSECAENELDDPGKVKCMVLIYEGINAVQKIRDVLGPTDPTKAPGGTVRRDFGSNVMVNTAHASDSVVSYEREQKILQAHKNTLCDVIDNFLNVR
ncbi:nucleoside-diphosphate kinase [Lentisphaerota bacterium WC36G]|nr:nucleoside-diphosphate kinase [Lentisphaerae bacterium WC36]